MKKTLKALAMISLMFSLSAISLTAGARDIGFLHSEAGAGDYGVMEAAARLFSRTPDTYQRMTPAEQDAYFEQATRSLSSQNRENLRAKYYQAIGRADATTAVQRTAQQQPNDRQSLASLGKISASLLGDVVKRHLQRE